MFADLRAMIRNSAPCPVILEIQLRGEVQLVGKILDKRFGNVLFGSGKTGFLLEVFQENGKAKPRRASLVGKEVHVLGE